jgi:RNA polymerase sigma-70 factor (ECF subfamily)
MPAQRQKVFKLSRKEGLSHKEIARELRISEKTVAAHIRLSIKTLRDLFRKEIMLAVFVLQLFGGSLWI